MTGMNISSLFRLASALLLTTILICLPGQAQESRRRVISHATLEPYSQSPVEIVSIRVRGELVEPGRPFSAGDDWLLGLSIRLKNVSDRPISFVDIGLRFPTVAGHKNKSVHLVGPFRYGCWPGVPCYPDATGSYKEILPGETQDVVLTEAGFRSLVGPLAQLGASTRIEAAEYDIDSVFFDADTRWSRGFLFKRDPLEPKTYKMVGKYESSKKPDWCGAVWAAPQQQSNKGLRPTPRQRASHVRCAGVRMMPGVRVLLFV